MKKTLKFWLPLQLALPLYTAVVCSLFYHFVIGAKAPLGETHRFS